MPAGAGSRAARNNAVAVMYNLMVVLLGERPKVRLFETVRGGHPSSGGEVERPGFNCREVGD